MLSIRQIRAARGLLGVSQAELAKKIGVSAVAMNNIERGNAKARAETLTDILRYFEGEGVEFTDGDGVRFVENVFNTTFYEGPEGAILFFKGIIKNLKRLPAHKREVCWYGDNTTPYMQKHKALYFYYRQLIEIEGKERIVVGKKTRDFYAPAVTSAYAVLDQDDTDKSMAGLYGENKYFLMVKQKILVMESPILYESMELQFANTWQRAKKIHLLKRLFDEDSKKWGKLKAA